MYTIKKIILFFASWAIVISLGATNTSPHVFSKTLSKFFTEDELSSLSGPTPEVVWQQSETLPFNELIVSWNALRPQVGYMTLWVSVKYSNQWSNWHRLAQWGKK